MKKRFIAGASCPKCQAQDTLRWWQADQQDHLECVVCDYQTARAVDESAESHGAPKSGGVIFQIPVE